MNSRRVAVTGLGLISPFGGSPQDFFTRLLNGESAIRAYTPADAPQPVNIAAVTCTHFDGETALSRGEIHTMDRFSQLGTAAADAAWRDAGLPDTQEARHEIGVSWGTAVGSVMTYDQGYRDLYINGRTRVSPLSVVLGMNNAAASHIAIKLGLGGACLTYTVACASSAVAIGEAFHRIRQGEAKLMLAGGSDAPLAFGVIRAWEALRILAPATGDSTPQTCKPFHQDRSGLVLAEGAGALMLEDWDHAVSRGARIHGEIVGYGTSCDHFNLVRPDPQGQVRAMELALEDAQLQPSDIDYINAHGTATREGDPAEIAAVRTVFGDRASRLPLSATKSMHGHTMGAAGAVESIVTLLALAEDRIPPTANLDQIDPDCEGVRHVQDGSLSGLGIRVAMSNSFAFGGSNAVLVFRRG